MTGQLPLALRLRDGLSLETFVVGANGAAMTALAPLLRGDGGQLYCYGTAGVGRTHLLTGAVRQAEADGRRACLLPARELVALPPALLEDLDRFDLLALDDLEQFAGLPEWEEALFHLYNRCRDRGAALLFAASAAPAAIGVQLPDLASRLAAGPVFRLQPLDDEDLAVLLQGRAARRGLALSDEVAAFIVHRGARTPAALLALLDRLDEHALARQRRLTIPLVKEALGW